MDTNETTPAPHPTRVTHQPLALHTQPILQILQTTILYSIITQRPQHHVGAAAFDGTSAFLVVAFEFCDGVLGFELD